MTPDTERLWEQSCNKYTSSGPLCLQTTYNEMVCPKKSS